MTALNSPHYRLFKAVFGRAEVAAEFMARYLPAGGGGAGLEHAAGGEEFVSGPGTDATSGRCTVRGGPGRRWTGLCSCTVRA